MARKARGLSQEDLALQAGIDRSFMGQVERGQRNVSVATLCRLATVVGRDLGSLCADLPDTPAILAESASEYRVGGSSQQKRRPNPEDA